MAALGGLSGARHPTVCSGQDIHSEALVRHHELLAAWSTSTAIGVECFVIMKIVSGKLAGSVGLTVKHSGCTR